MKHLLLIPFLVVTLLTAQGQTFSIGSPKTPDNTGTINLGRKPDGYWYEKSKTGAEVPFKVDPEANNLTVFQSLATVRGWTLSSINAPRVVTITDAHVGGMFMRDDQDNISADNTGITLVTRSGVRYKRVLTGGYLTPEMFGAIPGDTQDDAAAIQAAVDAACSTVGGSTRPTRTVLFSEGTYVLDAILNLTNTRTPGTLQRDGVRLVGQGISRTTLQGQTGAGKPMIEVTGSQFLSLSNLSLSTNGRKGSSTIGVYSGLFSVLPQTQNQTFDNIAIFMHDDPAANGGQGTIAYYNYGSEENTHQATYYRANRPAVLTADSRLPFHYTSSFGSQASMHSLGVTTFSGECFLEAIGSVQPALELVDVNSVHADNLYMSASVSAGIPPTQFQAIRIRGGASNCNLRGTIEGFSGMIQVYGRLANSDLHFQLGNIHGVDKAIIQLEQGEGTIDKCKIGANLSVKTNRPVWSVTTTSANQIASCYVKDSDIATNTLLSNMMMPEKLAFNPATTNARLHSANGQAYTYESGQQYTNIPKTLIRGFKGASPTTTLATIQLPTILAGNSALSAAVRLEGTAGHAIYVSGASTAIFWQGTLPVAVDQNGKVTVGSSAVTTIAGVAANAPGNILTGIVLSGQVVGNTVQVKLSPTVSGVNNEGVYFVGKITLYWMGHVCNAPSVVF